jgi:hypothetical protein
MPFFHGGGGQGQKVSVFSVENDSKALYVGSEEYWTIE